MSQVRAEATPSATSEDGTVWLSDVEQVAYLLEKGLKWSAIRRRAGKSEFRFPAEVWSHVKDYMNDGQVGSQSIQRARDRVYAAIAESRQAED